MKMAPENAYSPEWQEIRVNCLGNWMQFDLMHANLINILDYINRASNPSEQLARLYRAWNLADAVLYTYRGHTPEPDCAERVAWFRQELANIIRRTEQEGVLPEELTEERIIAEWRDLSAEMQKKILQNLHARYRQHSRREPLRRFIALVEKHSGPTSH